MNQTGVLDYTPPRLLTKENIKTDLVSGLVVTLVAIPLCLGIALACGLPLFAGIIPGIIGGILVGSLSQSQLSVSGPAAGMITVVIAGIAQLGGFDAFLFALFLAGILQIVMGALRLGFIADYIPYNVVQGLLCAIGFTIAVKQLPLALGYDTSASNFAILIKQSQEEFWSLTPLFHLATHMHLGVILVSVVSLLILVYFPKIKKSKFIPAPIVVIIVGLLINLLYKNTLPAFHISDPDLLVNITRIHSWLDLKSVLTFPDFSVWHNSSVYIVAITIAAVASLETLLNLEAVEKIDPKKHYCNRNRELVAQGLGNVTCGLIGGLPITSVIVRSSVNLQSGARSKLSTIFHGLFLLLATFILAKWLNYIPIASLAAILIYTGYKLSSPSNYIKMYKLGFANFFPFIVTVVAIIAFNLLEGALMGLAVSLLFILKKSSEKGFEIIKEKYPGGTVLHIMLPQQVSFLNKAALISELKHLPNNSRVIIDGYNLDYIDYDVTEVIKNFATSTASEKNISLNIEGIKNLPNIENRTDFMTTTTKYIQEKMTPKEILMILLEGNRRFMDNKLINRNLKYQMQNAAHSQHPLAVILGCVDSRVPVEIVFDLGIGDIFCARVAGNVVDDYIIASIEFACYVAKAKLILVMGHTACGAIKATCDGVELGHITTLAKKIDNAIQLETITKENRNSTNEGYVNNVAQLNINEAKKYLYEQSSILRQLIEQGEVLLVGAIYDIATGKVTLENDFTYTHPHH